MNNSLTVVFSDGDIIYSDNVSDELYNKIVLLTDKEEIKALICPELQKIYKENQEIIVKNQEIEAKVKDLIDTGKFELRDKEIYYIGINLPIPKLLVEAIHKSISDEVLYNSYINFWFWLSLNPNKVAREGTFDFIKRYNFKVTPHGFLLAYRRVISNKSDNEDYIKAISNAYIKIKTISKKSPKNYTIVKQENGDYTKCKIEDYPNAKNLLDQYLDLPNLQQKSFTDQYTKTFDIKIGQKVVMDRKDCDEDGKRSCSKGLHYCSSLSDYASFGDISLLVAINPRDIVSVPENHTSKSRTCGYFPIGILSNDESTILDTADCSDLLSEFFDEEVKLLNNQSFENVEKLKDHSLIADLKSDDFKEIVHNISEIKAKLKESYIINSQVNESVSI